MHPVYSHAWRDSEQYCRESVIRCVKFWRARGWPNDMHIDLRFPPKGFVEAVDAEKKHSGYSFGTTVFHAQFILRYGWRCYCANSRRNNKRRLKRR
jgi:hypothetical protein